MGKYDVRLAGTVIKYELIRKSPEKYAALFAAAKIEFDLHGTRPCCLCGTAKPELYMAKRVHPYLAGMPNTGSFHKPDCDFWKLERHGSGLSEYQGAFIDHGDITDVKFAFTLKRERQARTQTTTTSTSTSTNKRGATSLLGLLHFLWDKSRNSMWFPVIKGKEISTRSWSSTAYHLNQVVDSMTRSKAPLSDHLYVVPAFKKDAADQLAQDWARKFKGVIESANDASVKAKLPQQSLILIGEVKEFDQTKNGWRIHIGQTSQRVFLSASLHKKLLKSFPNAMSKLPSQLERVVMCGIITASDQGNLMLEDAALMRTNLQYIPVDSSFERKLADLLITEHRLFTKPLRYEAEDITLPDFVLLDAEDPECPLEVYGLAGQAEYDERMKKKIEYYQSKSETPWSWTPATEADIPALPARRLTKQ
jgi:hypothetical protein